MSHSIASLKSTPRLLNKVELLKLLNNLYTGESNSPNRAIQDCFFSKLPLVMSLYQKLERPKSTTSNY